jgi:hypothetical protein
MRAWMRGLVATGAAYAVLVAVPPPAAADLSLDITPAQYEFQADAGRQTTFPIMVRNVGNATVHVVASLVDVDTTAEGGGARFLRPGSKKFSASRWSEVNPREFDIPVDGVQQVRYTVNVPNGAHGEYPAFVFFTTRPPRKPGGFGLAESVASRLYTVVGDVTPGGAVDEVFTKPLDSGREYAVKFQNTGSMHEYIGGIVDVTSAGSNVDHIVLPPKTLVPRGEAQIVSAQGKKLPPGTYSAVAIVDYGGHSRVAGKTTFVVR